MACPRAIVLACAAHPDDIEFLMAGTVLRLRDAGAEIHLWNLADGACGTATLEPSAIAALRWREARDAAALIGATMHPPIAADLGLVYDAAHLARAVAVVRAVRPTVLLVQSPQDYMEDHQNACRLAVTAAFARTMRNAVVDPPTPPYDAEVAVYHALPHGLRDGLRRRVRAGQYVDVAPQLAAKRAMLACHRSQKEWLDVSQGMDAYLDAMESFAHDVGRLSGRFAAAEGWRRHNHLGFGPRDFDPLGALLGDACWTDPAYEADLDR